MAILLAEVLVIGPTLCFPSRFEYSLAFERAVPLAFRLCCFCFGAVFIVGVLSHLVFRAGCGIRLYRFLIIASVLSTSSPTHNVCFEDIIKQAEGVNCIPHLCQMPANQQIICHIFHADN